MTRCLPHDLIRTPVVHSDESGNQVCVILINASFRQHANTTTSNAETRQ